MKLSAPCDGVWLHIGFIVRQAATFPSACWLAFALMEVSRNRGCKGTVLRLNLASGSFSGDQSLILSGCQHPPYGCCATATQNTANSMINAESNLLVLIILKLRN